MKKCSFAAAVLAALFFLSVPGRADTVILQGVSLILTGTVTTSAPSINFHPTAPLPNFNIGGGTDLVFYGGTNTGSVYDIANSTSATDTPFITLTSNPLITFNLLGLYAPSGCTGTLGVICVTATGANTSVESFSGYGTGTINGESYQNVTYTFDSQTNNSAAYVMTNGDQAGSAYSFEVVASNPAAPEPITMLLSGVGLLGVGLWRRTRTKSRP